MLNAKQTTAAAPHAQRKINLYAAFHSSAGGFGELNEPTNDKRLARLVA
jgi:hypothetical protein